MYIGFRVVDAVVLALVIVLAIKYWRDREGGERRAKRWPAVLVGILLVISMAAFFLQPPTKGNWIGWLAPLGRLAIIWWLIMRDEKEARP
jgi:hypothetical protein